ncbi:hypothetical protein RBA16_26045, partial [Mycobacteroides abscessus subsp. massiliense]|uniref:hypothetical protein n=1 Tax=Mycobacteroides abscessus TaxID=36809 RepID=UPI003CF9397D
MTAFFGAGDGIRTRDIQLGKLTINEDKASAHADILCAMSTHCPLLHNLSFILFLAHSNAFIHFV